MGGEGECRDRSLLPGFASTRSPPLRRGRSVGGRDLVDVRCEVEVRYGQDVVGGLTHLLALGLVLPRAAIWGGAAHL
jgi:hypothetical protein